MRITVVYHEQIREALRDWLAELAAREPGGEVVARVATDVIRERFAECGGDPPEAVTHGVPGSRLRWWHYTRGFWLGYSVRSRGFGPWRSRRVIVAEVRVCPPDPDPSAVARA
jgi:hypothetical protein